MKGDKPLSGVETPSVLDQNTLDVDIHTGSAPEAPDLPATISEDEPRAKLQAAGRWIGKVWHRYDSLTDSYIPE